MILKRVRNTAIVFCVFFLFVGCDKNQTFQNNSSQPAQNILQVKTPPEFNKNDKSVETNGNISVAVQRIKGHDGSLEEANTEQVSTAELSKSPYSSIGKRIKIKGKIYKIEELPRDSNTPGNWSELLLIAPNKNSALDVSTIDFLYDGDTSNINSGDIVTCSGYFVGTFQSQNAMGGTVEALTIVGNKISK